MLQGGIHNCDTVANAYEGTVDDKDQPRTLGRMRVQLKTAVSASTGKANSCSVISVSMSLTCHFREGG